MAKRREVWLTTLDNPFDPFTNFENWNRFDEDHGYFTLSKICRVKNGDDELDDEREQEYLEEAIDTLLSFNLYGNWRKVERFVDDEKTQKET